MTELCRTDDEDTLPDGNEELALSLSPPNVAEVVGADPPASLQSRHAVNAEVRPAGPARIGRGVERRLDAGPETHRLAPRSATCRTGSTPRACALLTPSRPWVPSDLFFETAQVETSSPRSLMQTLGASSGLPTGVTPLVRTHLGRRPIRRTRSRQGKCTRRTDLPRRRCVSPPGTLAPHNIQMLDWAVPHQLEHYPSPA